MTNKEFNDQFRKRTFAFGVAVLKFIETISYSIATKVVSYQLAKASTSIGANYRAFCRGRSRNERFSKICIVVEEADETLYWLEICAQANYGDQLMLPGLILESEEILKITTSIKDSMYIG